MEKPELTEDGWRQERWTVLQAAEAATERAEAAEADNARLREELAMVKESHETLSRSIFDQKLKTQAAERASKHWEEKFQAECKRSDEYMNADFQCRGKLKAAERQLAEARKERDLAIAHDRQPYPTAWAYEQACKTIAALRAKLSEREAELAKMKEGRW